jgi:serum/glucocorticoid-regulated kinase 2
MSWKIGKSKSSKPNAISLSIQDMDARSTTPTPRNPDGKPQFRTGLLAIHVNRAEGLELPAGSNMPPAVQIALDSAQARAAESVSPSSVTQQRLAKGRGNRDSIQRTQCWWLPYLVMEFEVNQVLLTPLGGDVSKPVYMYQATLSVPFQTNPV